VLISELHGRRMGISCVSQDSILKKPELFDFAITQPTSPFTLSGAPLSNRPESLKNVSEFKRKSTALTNPSAPAYLSDSNYYIVNDDTSNIIGPDTSTSLRYEGNTYTQKFIAIHRSIWLGSTDTSSGTDAQVSIFFTDSRGNMFHICIPIVFTEVSENLFLKVWLHDAELKVPGGTTINDLLNFPQEKVSFATIQYCLQYNGNRSLNPYTLCYFKTPLALNANSVAPWLTKLLTTYDIPKETETAKKYMRNTFDEIFNLMMLGTVNTYNTTLLESKLVSNEQHIESSSNTQSAVKAVFYNVRTSDLSGKRSAIQTKGVKGMSNVKCYPIDLANQIDEQGNIFIDENTNKPIDLKSATQPESETIDFDGASRAAHDAKVAAAQTANSITYILILSIIGILIFGLLIAFILWMLPGWMPGSSSSSSRVSVTPAAAASAPLATTVDSASKLASPLATTVASPSPSLAQASVAAASVAAVVNQRRSRAATNATNASTATNATNASTATNATNASTATTASNASTATNATNASTATNASNATNASTATNATNASTATTTSVNTATRVR